MRFACEKKRHGWDATHSTLYYFSFTMISGDVLRMHLNYTSWASARLMEAVRDLSDTELRQDFGTADKTLIGTLVHIFGADRIWLSRVQGHSSELVPGPEYHDPAVLQPAWKSIRDGWESWANGMSDGDLQREISYHDLRRNPWHTPLWQVVLHVVNHGTHHRGQAAGFLRSMGHVPPPLDLVAVLSVSILITLGLAERWGVARGGGRNLPARDLH